MKHNVVNVESPSVPFDPLPDTRLWIGRAEAKEPVPFGARWIYRVDIPDVSRYWLLLTILEPYVFRVQFNGRREQTATVRAATGEVLERLPGWQGRRDDLGAPAEGHAFISRAPHAEVDRGARVTIATAASEHELDITWSEKAIDRVAVSRGTTGADFSTNRLTKAELAAITGWTLNQVDFFIVDIAATRTAEWWLSSEELTQIHEIAAQRPPLNNRRAIGRGREWATRAEMIRLLNERLHRRGEPVIERGSGVRGLQRWASEAVGFDAIRAIDPPLFTAAVDIVYSGEYRS